MQSTIGGGGSSSANAYNTLPVHRRRRPVEEWGHAAVPVHLYQEAITSSSEYVARSQYVAAVAEEEWDKRGIGFKSRAERGTGFWHTPEAAAASGQAIGGGSSLLANLIQHNFKYMINMNELSWNKIKKYKRRWNELEQEQR